jgi:DNA-binding transcriptional LysR family regulator
MLEMREIEAFLAVAEELHFGRAARRLRLSTSRVSSLVRSAERRAGATLFERTSRAVRLTAAGEQMFIELRAAYIRIERALLNARHTGELGGGVLKAGFATTLPAAVPARMVREFERRFPECPVVASNLPSNDLFSWLGHDWPVDVFVTWMPPDSAPVEPPLRIGPVLHREPRAVMLPEGHPLGSDGAPVDIEQLAEHEVLYPELPAWYAAHWAPELTPHGRPLKLRRVPARYLEDMVRLVIQAGLVHLTFRSVLDNYRRPGVVVRPLTGLPPVAVRAVWPDGPLENRSRQLAHAL